jgi:nucleoside-diphosphate-sugar epimerase
MKRVVITGPTGTIGMALIHKFIENNVEVLAICRKGSKGIPKIPCSKYVRVVECDLSELKGFTDSERYEVFYHFAWEGTSGDARNDMYLQNLNVLYTLDAVLLAKKLGCHTFIGAGSQAEYGLFDGTLTPFTPTFPDNGYGMAKLCAGQMSRFYSHQLGMKHIWPRILSVYGPFDDEKTMVMSSIREFLHGNSLQYTKGEQMWDFLFCEDAANAMYLLGEKGRDGKVYCLGSGKTLPLYEFITEIRNCANIKSEIHFGAIPYTVNQVMHLCADITGLQNDVGFAPTIEFKEGIVKTIEWYRENFV